VRRESDIQILTILPAFVLTTSDATLRRCIGGHSARQTPHVCSAWQPKARTDGLRVLSPYSITALGCGSGLRDQSVDVKPWRPNTWLPHYGPRSYLVA